jgi:hypothetical protein
MSRFYITEYDCKGETFSYLSENTPPKEIFKELAKLYPEEGFKWISGGRVSKECAINIAENIEHCEFIELDPSIYRHVSLNKAKVISDPDWNFE